MTGAVASDRAAPHHSQGSGRETNVDHTVVIPSSVTGVVRSDVANEEGFSAPQACKLVGLSYRQIDYWARTGLLRPSLLDGKGSGRRRRYSYRDLVQLKVIRRLLDAGIGLVKIRRAVPFLDAQLGEDLASASLVVNGSESPLVHHEGELVDALRHGQGVFSVVAPGGAVGRAGRGNLRPRSRAARGSRCGRRSGLGLRASGRVGYLNRSGNELQSGAPGADTPLDRVGMGEPSAAPHTAQPSSVGARRPGGIGHQGGQGGRQG